MEHGACMPEVGLNSADTHREDGGGVASQIYGSNTPPQQVRCMSAGTRPFALAQGEAVRAGRALCCGASLKFSL